MINSLPNMDPESYAKQYATENNISVDEARTQLRAKYGDPQAPSGSIFSQNNAQNNIFDSLSLDDLDLSDLEEGDSVSLKKLLKNLLGLLRGKVEDAASDSTETNDNTTSTSTEEKKTATTTTATTTTSSSTSTSNTQKTKDDYYKTIADACGIDNLTASAIAKAVADGSVSGRPEEVVPKLAYDLGLPQETVSKVLKYLNNGSI